LTFTEIDGIIKTMRTLRVYMLKEFISPYLGSMAFFTMLLLLERVMGFLGLVAKGYASVIDFLVLLFFSVPPTLALTMPMSTVMGALIAVGRLSNDSEITAVKAGGIRLSALFVSLYAAGVFIGGASFFLTDSLVPLGNIKFRTLYQRLTIARPDAQIIPGGINTLSGSSTFLVERVDEKTGDLLDVTIFEDTPELRTISSKRGTFLPKDDRSRYLTLRLFDGIVLDSGKGREESFSSTRFVNLDMNIKTASQEILNVAKTPSDMNIAELRNGLREQEKKSRSHNSFLMELHKRIAIPFACVLFALLGTPFAVTRGRSGKGLGLGVGVLIIFFYYTFLIVLERMGRSGAVPPALAVWTPNILFFVAGTFFLVKRGRM
jgi:LPS export ABC transporter permease LptF